MFENHVKNYMYNGTDFKITMQGSSDRVGNLKWPLDLYWGVYVYVWFILETRFKIVILRTTMLKFLRLFCNHHQILNCKKKLA